MTQNSTEKPAEQFFKHRLWATYPFTVSSLVEHLRTILSHRGYEVKTDRMDYRVLMARKESRQWTQGHTRKHELFIDLTGPETPAIVDLLQTIYQQGEDVDAPGHSDKIDKGSG